MTEERYYIKISPESLKSDVIQETLSGVTFGVYSGMSHILSGGTDGSSLLTGITIPVVFTQTYDDMGVYTPFDGFILQKDVVTNFLFIGDPNNQYVVRVYNTSDQLKKFLKLSSYVIDWGDGIVEPFTSVFPNYMEHTYPPTEDSYVIKLTQRNPWGITNVEKPVKIPVEEIIINNPLGNVTFTQMGGSWSGIPIDYNFIFTGDSENSVSLQTSNNWTTVPFVISGYTSSKLEDLSLYGPTKFNPGTVVTKNGLEYGLINDINSEYTSYTIQNVDYYDYPNGKTVYFIQSSGITDNMVSEELLTKEEILFGVVSPPEIQSQIFIDRGKNSAFEGIQRLGEVDNIGDLISYGYGFFKIKEEE